MDRVGLHLFSFDKKKIYNLFTDYPYAMTEEEIAVFNRENRSGVNFFKIDLKIKKVVTIEKGKNHLLNISK